MRLNEFNDYIISKDEFIDYYNRSICLGLTICEDAVFKIYPYKYIVVDISNVKDKYVTIPSFVDSVVSFSIYTCYSVNRDIEVLDLNCTKVLGKFSLSNFKNLSLVKGKELIAIGTEAFRECGNLSYVDLPKVRQIGEKAFFYCKRLSSLKFPNLLYAGRFWLSDCSSLTYLSVPLLKKMKYLGYNLNRSVLKLDYTSPMLMEEQDTLFKNSLTGDVFNWRGTVFDGFTRDSYDRIIPSYYTECYLDGLFDCNKNKYNELKKLYKTNKYGYLINVV